MQTDLELALWQMKAESAFEELKNLNHVHQLEQLRAKSSEIDDVYERKAFEYLVFSLLQTYNGTSAKSKTTFDKIFGPNGVAVAAFFLAFMTATFEVKIGVIWSIVVAAIAAVSVRTLFRLFDRGFYFQRLFGVWFTGGLIFIGGPSLVVYFETAIGTVEWGGPPSSEAIIVWISGLFVSGSLALWEAKTGGGR